MGKFGEGGRDNLKTDLCLPNCITRASLLLGPQLIGDGGGVVEGAVLVFVAGSCV